MFSLVITVKLIWPFEASAVMTWSGVGEVKLSFGGSRVDDERQLSVGIGRVGLVAALVDDDHPGHVVAAVVAGHRREQAVGPDVVEPGKSASGFVLVTSPVLAASTPTVTWKSPPAPETPVPAFCRMYCARFERSLGSWSGRSRTSECR